MDYKNNYVHFIVKCIDLYNTGVCNIKKQCIFIIVSISYFETFLGILPHLNLIYLAKLLEELDQPVQRYVQREAFLCGTNVNIRTLSHNSLGDLIHKLGYLN